LRHSGFNGLTPVGAIFAIMDSTRSNLGGSKRTAGTSASAGTAGGGLAVSCGQNLEQADRSDAGAPMKNCGRLPSSSLRRLK
jgi:hypothetical protein